MELLYNKSLLRNKLLNSSVGCTFMTLRFIKQLNRKLGVFFQLVLKKNNSTP